MEGDRIYISKRIHFIHFNPLPPHGGRQKSGSGLKRLLKFQSTPSAWRETLEPLHPILHIINFNPLPPHGGRRVVGGYPLSSERISIHSLRMEGDAQSRRRCKIDCEFQSTPSAWRETLRTAPKSWRNTIFQSTPSAWRETFDIKI